MIPLVKGRAQPGATEFLRVGDAVIAAGEIPDDAAGARAARRSADAHQRAQGGALPPDHSRAVRPLPGVAEALQWFKRHGFKQAIASSAPPANIDFLIDELGLRDSFDAIVSGYDLPGKPAPDVFLLAAWPLTRSNVW